jgi:A/G-specific adenine glycosylase
VAWLITRGSRDAPEVALVRRPDRGLLGGMLALPTTEWRLAPPDEDQILREAPVRAAWRHAGAIEHVFTHFALTLRVLRAEVSHPGPAEAIWTPLDAVDGLPSVFLKALRAGLNGLL